MADFYSQKKVKMFLYSHWFLSVLGIASLFFLYSAFSTMQKNRETLKNRKIAELHLEELKKEDFILNKDIESLKTNDGLERIVRSRFNVVKEGEGVIMVVDAPIINETSDEKTSGFVNFFKKIFNRNTKVN